VTPLERLFRLELEFFRRLRTEALSAADTPGLHTSYALQSGYEALVGAVGTVAEADVERLTGRLAFAGDARDILAARDSLKELLGLALRDV
jgi:hypothetical protein